MTIAEKLTTIAENEQKVYEAGKAQGTSEWWDEFQQNGTRSNYRLAFGGSYWNDERFKQYKYPISLASGSKQGYMMFAYSNMVDLASCVKEEDKMLVLYAAQYAFAYSSTLQHIGGIELTGYTANVFGESSKLSVIDELKINTTSGTNPFGGNTNLTYIKFSGKDTIGIPINLSSASGTTTITLPEDIVERGEDGEPILDDNGHQTVIAAAGTEVTETGLLYNPTIKTLIPALKTGAKKTLTLGPNFSKLTERDIEIITQEKGWSVVE